MDKHPPLQQSDTTNHHRITWKPKPLPMKELGQIKCPHCSMFKVTTTKVELITVGERQITVQEVHFHWASMAKYVYVFAALGVVALWVSLGEYISCIVTGALMLVISPVLLFLISNKKRQEGYWAEEGNLYGPYLVRRFHYLCNIDGYKWTWQDDQPLPGSVANIDPQFLNAAIQHYEEEERIKQERAAAAATYYEQQERQRRERNRKK